VAETGVANTDLLRKSIETMTMTSTMNARLKLVHEHVAFENEHDLDRIMETFGESARYDDEPWDAHYHGRDEVRAFYADLLRALPDLHIDIKRQHVTEDAVILEVIIRGRHLGSWRGLPPTGRPVEFPLCGIFTFDETYRLAGEKIYYDRATVLPQLGIFDAPESLRGRITAAVTHPLTMARIVGRRILGRLLPQRPPS
jgi:steroid delta-isomerase-like uncharacterized protein